MSDFVAYLKVEPYLKQWIEYHFGSPAKFDPRGVENATIVRFLTTLPEGVEPMMKQEGEVAICIPDSKAKPVQHYNYLGVHAKKAVVECIKGVYKMQMWNELNELYDKDYTIITAVRAWCENNGISIDFDNTIKMQWQRMRQAYLKNGIDLRKKQRNRE